MQSARRTVDPNGSVDYGNIEVLRYVGDGAYSFGGDCAENFGEVSVKCEGVRLEIK